MALVRYHGKLNNNNNNKSYQENCISLIFNQDINIILYFKLDRITHMRKIKIGCCYFRAHA